MRETITDPIPAWQIRVSQDLTRRIFGATISAEKSKINAQRAHDPDSVPVVPCIEEVTETYRVTDAPSVVTVLAARLLGNEDRQAGNVICRLVGPRR